VAKSVVSAPNQLLRR